MSNFRAVVCGRAALQEVSRSPGNFQREKPNFTWDEQWLTVMLRVWGDVCVRSASDADEDVYASVTWTDFCRMLCCNRDDTQRKKIFLFKCTFGKLLVSLADELKS